MPPEISRTALQVGMWISLLAAACILFTERGSAEYYVSILSLGVGLVLLGFAVFVVRRSKR